MNHPGLDSTIVSGVGELVRGQEQQFIDELQPLVRSQSVRLDLSRIERIDAAGLAALISLCRDARRAGYEFTVVNPSRHVARMLTLVGLDRIVARANQEVLTVIAPPAPTVTRADDTVRPVSSLCEVAFTSRPFTMSVACCPSNMALQMRAGPR